MAWASVPMIFSKGENMKTAKLLLVLAGCFVLSGCAVYEAKQFLTPEGSPTDAEIAASYFATDLKKSSAADVLPLIHMPDDALLSQSTKVWPLRAKRKRDINCGSVCLPLMKMT